MKIRSKLVVSVIMLIVICCFSCSSANHTTKVYGIGFDTYLKGFDSSMHHIYDTLFIYCNTKYPSIKIYKADQEYFHVFNYRKDSFALNSRYFIQKNNETIGEFYFKFKNMHANISIDSFYNLAGCKILTMPLDTIYTASEKSYVNNDTLNLYYAWGGDSLLAVNTLSNIHYKLVNDKIKDKVFLNSSVGIEEKYKKRLVEFSLRGYGYNYSLVNGKMNNGYVSAKLELLNNYNVEPIINEMFAAGKIVMPK